MDDSTLALHQKLDALTAQVAYLTEQAQAAANARVAQTDLIETAMPIAKEVMDLASQQLEEVEDYVDLPDLLRLLKKLVRQAPRLEMMLDQADGVVDLMDTVAPLTKEVVDAVTNVFEGLENKGYFTLARSGMSAMDAVVTSFTPEELEHLADNTALLVGTVKDIAKPELITFLRETFNRSERALAEPVNNTSLFAILGQMQDPAVRRGLVLTLRILRVVGQQAEEAARSAA